MTIKTKVLCGGRAAPPSPRPNYCPCTSLPPLWQPLVRVIVGYWARATMGSQQGSYVENPILIFHFDKVGVMLQDLHTICSKFSGGNMGSCYSILITKPPSECIWIELGPGGLPIGSATSAEFYEGTGSGSVRAVRDSEGFISRPPKTKSAVPTRPQPTLGTCLLHVVRPGGLCEDIIDDDDVKIKMPELKRADSSDFIVSCHKRHFDTLLSGESWRENARGGPYRHPTS